MPTRAASDADQEAYFTQQAQKYLASLPLEHFMESTTQATQRSITVASLDLVVAQRTDFHLFSELLVQWSIPRRRRPGQIVPDNMVVLHEGEIIADTHFTIDRQPARPFWVFEYVSASSERKDYGSSLAVYEQSLAIPYYLTFHPDGVGLTLFRLNRRGQYRAVRADTDGRRPIREIDMAVGMIEGWVRYWYQGELLPLPAELQTELFQTRERLSRAEAERDRAEEARAQEAAERVRAEEARAQEAAERVRAEEARAQEAAERVRAEEARAQEAAERVRAEEERAQEAAERVRAEEARAQEAAERVRAEEERGRAETQLSALENVLAAERAERQALLEELARLRAAQNRPPAS